jgi:hypothetical protein
MVQAAASALLAVGFYRDSVMDVTVFLDGKEGKSSQGIHILLADTKVKAEYASSTPSVESSTMIDGKRIVNLIDLVEMKLNAYRLKDRTHLVDMIQIGLIDQSWPTKFVVPLSDRLQALLDNPDG